QLGYLPRMQVVHTSSAEIGQVYMPAVNWTVMAATILLVIAFRSSTSLAGAYGVAVSMTMIITTILAGVVARDLLHWTPAAGTAVFMHRTNEVIPPALLHSLKHYKALHQQVILLTIIIEEVAHLNGSERIKIDSLGEGIFCVSGRYGYMEEPDIPELLQRIAR